MSKHALLYSNLKMSTFSYIAMINTLSHTYSDKSCLRYNSGYMFILYYFFSGFRTNVILSGANILGNHAKVMVLVKLF